MICLALYTWHFRKPIWTFFLSILLIAPIRIHIAAGIVLAFLLSVFFSMRRYSWKVKALVGFVSLIAFFLAFKIALQVTNSLNTQEFGQYIASDDAKYSNTNMGIDLSGAPWIVKVFSFLFLPLSFTSRNYFITETSVESIFWIFLCVTIILRFCKRHNRKEINWHYLGFALLSILILSFGLAYGNSNLGIAVRQKTMIFPFLYYSLFLLERPNQLRVPRYRI